MSSNTTSPSAPPRLRIVFVDDESSLLDGMRRAMRSMRHLWDMSFVTSGAEAFALVTEQFVDVIVSDMRMPNMDGLELLTRVREESPHTARIVLSGQTEMQTALRSVSVAHVFLHKPCEPEVIKQSIERTVELTRELGSQPIQRLLSEIDYLPSPPALVQRLNEALLQPETDIDEVIDILSLDVAVTAKLLQLSNSAFFGTTSTVHDVRSAVMLLGLAAVRDLAAGSKLVDSLLDRSGVSSLDRLDAHSVEVARLASELCSNATMKSEAFSAGVLHDIGELVIEMRLPKEHQKILEAMAGGLTRTAAELQVLETTHAAIGAHLLQLWGLPQAVVEAIAWHHSAADHQPWELSALHAVYVAEAFVGGEPPLPADYLAALGVELPARV